MSGQRNGFEREGRPKGLPSLIYANTFIHIIALLLIVMVLSTGITVVLRGYRPAFKPNDRACRYGGEEFVVIMPGADINDGRMVAMRISNSFKSLRFKPRDDLELQWSLSIGISRMAPNKTAASLSKRADQALYEAKAKGGDRIEVAS